jgi:two-component system, OmpR family, sensor histidine kinase SenX3
MDLAPKGKLAENRCLFYPYYRLVNPIGVAIAALVVGIGIGVLLVWVRQRTRQAELSPTFEVSEPVVPAGVAEVLAVLPSAGVVVGPHDEVLETTAMARTLGLVRNSRISLPELLTLVRAVRRDGDVRTVDLQINRGVRVASTYLTARIAPLDQDLIVVLADDQTAARRIDETRRDFVANISHELKTPIGAIALLAEAVEEAANDPAAVRKFASRMGIESARLTDLVSQIIELSGLQSDNPLVAPEIVDIDEVLAEAVDRRRMDAERNRITLTVAGISGTRVMGSARQLEVAVGNLVENAIAYSDPGARVVVAAHVQARSDDDYVEITVSDNGIGIPPAEVDRIFERFYRVDYARSRANGGNGLGLAIVKHIAAIHGGEVAVWSQVGQGSTFTIRIPAHLHEVPAAVAEPAASADAEHALDKPAYQPQVLQPQEIKPQEITQEIK